MARWTSIASVTAAAALSVLAATAVVDAQSPGQQLDACADVRGTLRLVAPSEACVTGERRVSWSVVGPTGATGAVGPTGTAGARGPAGPRGRTGKVALKLSGDAQVVVALKLLNKRVKAVGDQVSAVNAKLTALDGKIGKAAALGQRAYERIYHVCLGVESAKAAFGYTPASVGIARCKFGFYKPFPGYDPQP
ncbi:MAG: hypothetical protein V7607_1873 [Solirubrobacteraceae bacterium]